MAEFGIWVKKEYTGDDPNWDYHIRSITTVYKKDEKQFDLFQNVADKWKEIFSICSFSEAHLLPILEISKNLLKNGFSENDKIGFYKEKGFGGWEYCYETSELEDAIKKTIKSL